MKYLAILAVCCLVSCASDPGNWNTSDPNDESIVPGDSFGVDPYSATSKTPRGRTMTDDEIMALTQPQKKKRFHGSLSFGVGTRL